MTIDASILKDHVASFFVLWNRIIIMDVRMIGWRSVSQVKDSPKMFSMFAMGRSNALAKMNKAALFLP